jgi:hypothetical protein
MAMRGDGVAEGPELGNPYMNWGGSCEALECLERSQPWMWPATEADPSGRINTDTPIKRLINSRCVSSFFALLTSCVGCMNALKR